MVQDWSSLYVSIQICLFPTSSLTVGCFEDMSPFAASNFDSPLAATEEAGNDSERHACTFRTNSWSRSVATWKRVNHWWRLLFLLRTKWVFSASQMPFLRGADGPALRIKGRAGNQSGDRGSYHWAQLPALFDIPVVSRSDIYSRLISPLTLAQHLNRKLDTSRGFAVHVLWTGRTCLDALLLSRLMSTPERLKWWRLHPGMSSSTQSFNVQSLSNLLKTATHFFT